MTSSHLIRRQITLFVPDPHRSRIDSIRKRFNPAQSALIDAHVTLCRDDEVENWSELQSRVRQMSPINLLLRFGEPVRIDQFVSLPVVRGTDEFDELRRQVLGDKDCRKHKPHLTLIHPRNGTCSNRQFEEIRGLLNEELTISFRAATFIEQISGQPWSVLCSIPL